MGLDELMKLNQVTPKDWGAMKDYDSWAHDLTTDQAVVHWGGTKVRDAANEGSVASEKATLRGWESYHVNNRKWAGIAYDWAIGQSGTLYRCRGRGRSAATSGDYDGDGIPNNAESEAIVCLIGYGQEPSEKMLATLATVLQALGYDTVIGHKEAKGTSTACPGDDLMEFVKRYRRGDTTVEPEPSRPKKRPARTSSKELDYMKQIKRGDRNSQVKIAQALLNLILPEGLIVDGIFGLKTEAVVREFQRRWSLSADGIVGPKTWKALLTAQF